MKEEEERHGLLISQIEGLKLTVEQLKFKRNELVEDNKKQLLRIRHLEEIIEQYTLERESILKEKMVEDQFQSTFEKERIDSNKKMSSEGTKRNLASFKPLAEQLFKQAPFYNDYRQSAR